MSLIQTRLESPLSLSLVCPRALSLSRMSLNQTRLESLYRSLSEDLGLSLSCVGGAQRREPPIGHQLGVVEEPRAHPHQSHAEEPHREAHTAHRESHSTSRSADNHQSQSDAAVANRARPPAPDYSDGKSSRMGAAAGVGAGGAVLRGVLAGRKLHEDLMQVLCS